MCIKEVCSTHLLNRMNTGYLSTIVISSSWILSFLDFFIYLSNLVSEPTAAANSLASESRLPDGNIHPSGLSFHYLFLTSDNTTDEQNSHCQTWRWKFPHLETASANCNSRIWSWRLYHWWFHHSSSVNRRRIRCSSVQSWFCSSSTAKPAINILAITIHYPDLLPHFVGLNSARTVWDAVNQLFAAQSTSRVMKYKLLSFKCDH